MIKDFRLRIIPMLIKIIIESVFDNTDKLKKSNLGAKIFSPKSNKPWYEKGSISYFPAN